MDVPSGSDVNLVKDLAALLVIFVFSLLGVGTVLYELKGFILNFLQKLGSQRKESTGEK